MTIEEIRKNKPDGATHYFKNSLGVVYFRKNHIVWHAWIESEKYWSLQKFKPHIRLMFKPLN